MTLRAALLFPFVLLAFQACGAEAAVKADQSSPKALAESIFTAARSGKFAGLEGIAATSASAESKDLAGVGKAEAKKQESFREHFAKAKVNGEAKVEGDKAQVPVMCGPDGTKAQTLKMVKVNGVWYLEGF